MKIFATKRAAVNVFGNPSEIIDGCVWSSVLRGPLVVSCHEQTCEPNSQQAGGGNVRSYPELPHSMLESNAP